MQRTVRFLIAVGALLSIATDSTYAQRISDAVVRVVAGNAAGCGTLVATNDERGYLLTAAHVVENGRSVRAIWHDGHSSQSRVLVANSQLDVALLEVHPPQGAATIPLADGNHWPQRGDTVELIGYGGGKLRHWTATVNGYAMTESVGRHQTLSLNTQTIGGDSGGAIVWRGKLVGVIWGGPLAGPRGPMLATHGTSCVAIETFLEGHNIDLAAINRTQIYRPAVPSCRDGSCPLPPRIATPTPRNNDTQKLLESISRLEQRIAQLERHPNLNINLKDASQHLLDAMATDPRFRGPPGRDGRNGADGRAAPVDVERLTERIKERLAGSIRVRVEPVR